MTVTDKNAIDIEVEIPADTMRLGHDADGLPRTEAVESKEVAETPVVAKPEAKEKPAVKPVVTTPRFTDADYEAARRATERAQAERDEYQRAAEAERTRTSEVERELQTRTGQALRAHWHAVNSDYQQLTNAITSTKLEAEQARRDLRLAHEQGDPDKMGEANERIATAATHLASLEQGKHGAEGRIKEAERAIEAARTALEKEPAERPAVKEKAEEKPAAPAQPRTPEEWIAQFPRKTTGQWLTSHKEYVTDPGKHKELLDFANEWAADYGPQFMHTPQFVEALSAKFAPPAAEEPEEQEEEVIEIDTTPKRAEAKPAVAKSTPAAPVSRASTPGARPSSPSKVRLTPDQQFHARELYPELAEREAFVAYADGLRRAEKDGHFQPRN